MSGLQPNSDFLNDTSKQKKQSDDASVSKTDGNEQLDKKKRRTSLEVEMEKFPEYYALTEYQRRCLITNNYWRVMNGEPIVEAPPSDKHYRHYFDKRCYEMAVEYAATKKRGKIGDKQDTTNILTETHIAESKEVVESPQIINKASDNKVKAEKAVEEAKPTPEPKVEVKPEIKPKVNPDTKCDFDIEEIADEAIKKFPSTMEKLSDKNNNEPQLSLF